MIECVPNVSEGRRADVIESLAAAIGSVEGVQLLHWCADPSHNRSVFTFAGEAEPLQQAVLKLFGQAIARIDLRSHQGVHPRIGVVDVVPFVPLAGSTMSECVTTARATAEAAAKRFAIPVYLYEEAASSSLRRNLADIRRGGFEALALRMADTQWLPDYGPPAPHPTAGATAIGARRALIAYNVNLATDRLDVARRIASRIRSSSGGLPAVKAMGVPLDHRGVVQVTMNLTDYQQTSMRRAFDFIRQEAEREGVTILESELIGLVPADAMADVTPEYLKLTGFDPSLILENRLKRGREPFS
jgi:glutamate formiminotransferase